MISESQSAFQYSKAISDNILVAFELLHHMKTQKSKKADFMTLKLDMSKAYDRVEWHFLIEIMKKMGFCDAWVNLIYGCINTVSYSILVNGEPKAIYLQLGESARGTHYHHIFSYYARKG